VQRIDPIDEQPEGWDTLRGNHEPTEEGEEGGGHPCDDCRERETDRQRVRETERERDREKDRERETERETETERDREKGRESQRRTTERTRAFKP
jgi:hypothetical protein